MFGFSYGGVMPLYAILVREYFGARIMGTVFGAVAMVSTLGMAIGPWAGGWLLRSSRQLFLALYRFVRHRARGGGDRAHLPPAAPPSRSPSRLATLPPTA